MRPPVWFVLLTWASRLMRHMRMSASVSESVWPAALFDRAGQDLLRQESRLQDEGLPLYKNVVI